MTAVPQTTLRGEVEIAGTALHSGKFVQLHIKPAPPDHGIVFYRTDLSDGFEASDRVKVPADFKLVHDTTLGTSLRNSHGVEVCTVEHLMAAFAGCSVDNAIVLIDGPEVPILDGSSKQFVRHLDSAGICAQDVSRRYIRVIESISVASENKSLELLPFDGFEVAMSIDFDAAAVGRQHHEITLVNGAFRDEISSARTFGFSHEVQKLRSLGLALGGSLDNSIVVEGDRILNDGGLRYNDEFVRHKILDVIGDLYLAGAPILARVVGVRSGHTLNSCLLRALFESPEKWVYETRQQSIIERESHVAGTAKEVAVA